MAESCQSRPEASGLGIVKSTMLIFAIKTALRVHQLILLSFVEGIYVLSVELLGAKMLSSYYGSSLLVWTSVIGTTLLFLTIGYFIGGKISQKGNPKNALFIFLLLASFSFALMPLAATPLLKFSYSSNLYGGTILSAIILLGLPLTCLATISPLLIQAGTQRITISGKISGWVYGVSTLGGIAASFLLGFYLIPQWGITMPSVVLAALLAIFTIIFFFDKKKITVAVVFFVAFTFDIIYLKKQTDTGSTQRVIYESEGILGQLKVLDSYNDEIQQPIRRLLINGIPQTYIAVNPQMPYSNWLYVHFIAGFASLKPKGSRALLMGFGGGSIAAELVNRQFKIDVVELDKRMLSIAKDHFYFDDSKINFIVDDARHYLQSTDKKYDLLVFDLLNGEVQPSYVFSLQSFNRMKEVLKDDGMILIEYQGYLSGEKSKGVRAVYKTMLEAGYQVFFKNTGAIENITDVVYLASKTPPDFSKIKLSEMNYCCKIKLPNTDFFENPFSKVFFKTDDIMELDDDAPILDIYNAASIMDTRKEMIQTVTLPQMKEGIRLFK